MNAEGTLGYINLGWELVAWVIVIAFLVVLMVASIPKDEGDE